MADCGRHENIKNYAGEENASSFAQFVKLVAKKEF